MHGGAHIVSFPLARCWYPPVWDKSTCTTPPRVSRMSTISLATCCLWAPRRSMMYRLSEEGSRVSSARR